MAAIDNLIAGVEQYLRELSDDEFHVLINAVRPTATVHGPGKSTLSNAPTPPAPGTNTRSSYRSGGVSK
jgi:hypothetical protein